MLKISDVFTLSALAVSFVTSGPFYFSGYKTQALLTTISAFGICIKQSMLHARGVKV